MPRELVDLLWRHHPAAPGGSGRGPRARLGADDVVEAAIGLADREGLAAVTVRRLAEELRMAPMSVYTYVTSRDDLLVLMADAVHGRMERPAYGRRGWRARVRQVADANLALLEEHPWLLDVVDDRTALGPGTIAKYDHELQALAPMRLDALRCDAALTFVLDYVRAAARSARPGRHAEELAGRWPEWGRRLAVYVGDEYPLARAVGGAAGEAMGGASSPALAWEFGLARVLDGLAALEARPR